MKKRNIIIISCLLVFFLFVFVQRSFSQDERELEKEMQSALVTEERSQLSPSGKYLLALVLIENDEVSGYGFTVTDVLTNSIVLAPEDHFRLRDTNYIMWGDYDTIWAYSGDLGIFYWRRESDIWVRINYSHADEALRPPELLIKLRPKVFD